MRKLHDAKIIFTSLPPNTKKLTKRCLYVSFFRKRKYIWNNKKCRSNPKYDSFPSLEVYEKMSFRRLQDRKENGYINHWRMINDFGYYKTSQPKQRKIQNDFCDLLVKTLVNIFYLVPIDLMIPYVLYAKCKLWKGSVYT